MALLFLTLSHLTAHISLKRGATLSLTDLNTLFTLSIAGFSSQIEIVHHLSTIVLSHFRKQYACDTLNDLLRLDSGYLLNNLMVRLKSNFSAGRQLLMLVRTIKSECSEIMGSVVTEMVEIVINKIDLANMGGDQELLKNAIDIAMVVTEYVQEHSYEIKSKFVKEKKEY